MEVQELTEAKVQLAEIIDEVVFAEREKEQALQDLGRARADAAEIERQYVTVVEGLLRYLCTLERDVVVPAVGEVTEAVSGFHEAAQQRSNSMASLSAINARSHPQLARIFSMIEAPSAESVQQVRAYRLSGRVPHSVEDAYVLAAALLETKTELQSSLVNALPVLERRAREIHHPPTSSIGDADGEKEALRARVAELEAAARQHVSDRETVGHKLETLTRALENSGAYSPNGKPRHAEEDEAVIRNQQREIVELRNELREARHEHEQEGARLRKELASKALQAASAGGGSSEVDTFLRDLQRGAHGEATQQRGEAVQYQAKIRAFEMTISALNAELAALEDKIIGIERRASDERQALQEGIVEERRRHKQEQEECDQVVERLTTEIEQLMRENAQHKQRLKHALGH